MHEQHEGSLSSHPTGPLSSAANDGILGSGGFMVDSIRMGAAADALGAQHGAQRSMPLRFNGSGSEYFRIWIVNLLLTLLTLGIYYPWAKARRLRYFHGNTVIGGHPLGFHGEPRKMLRGSILVGLLLVLYSVAGEFSSLAGLIAFIIVAAVWPALFKSSQQFRLANTSWRGLRFHFTGNLPGAYRAMLPLFIPGLLVLAPLLAGPDGQEPPAAWYPFVLLGFMAMVALLAPLLLWNLKKYQHDHYALGSLQMEFRTSSRAFYGVALKTAGIFVLTLLGVGAAILGVTLLTGGAASVLEWERGRGSLATVFSAMIVLVMGLLLMYLVPVPYFTSRLQNLVWSRTGNSRLRFKSQLRFRPLLGLTLKNWLLVLLTLGFYWPFAAVAMARLRLEAVTLVARMSLDEISSLGRAREGDAAGDAAGDLLGIDVGL